MRQKFLRASASEENTNFQNIKEKNTKKKSIKNTNKNEYLYETCLCLCHFVSHLRLQPFNDALVHAHLLLRLFVYMCMCVCVCVCVRSGERGGG